MVALNAAIANTARSGRVSRRPQHPFYLKDVRPFQIQPCLIAPVLPGETLQNMLLQSRVVTDPLANPLIGWHCEYYMFYVKLTDLDDHDALTSLILDPGYDASALDDATDAKHFHLNGTPSPAIDYVGACLNRVVDTYFRTESESASDHTLDGLPLAKVNTSDWRDSFESVENIEDPFDIDLTSTTAGVGDGTSAVTTAEIDAAMREFMLLKDHSMIDMTYEQYLSTFGVRTNAPQSRIPELLRYSRNWTYPTNTVDPSTGTPSSACVWSIAERADKARFFREPGFIFACQILRPKVYSASIRASLTSLLNKAQDWLPATLSHDNWSSLRKVASAAPPVTDTTSDYVIDLKDLFLYGEQFLNFDPNGTAADNAVNLPRITAGSPDVTNKHYPVSADLDALFSSALSNKVRTDGVFNLNVKGNLRDTTPQEVGQSDQ